MLCKRRLRLYGLLGGVFLFLLTSTSVEGQVKVLDDMFVDELVTPGSLLALVIQNSTPGAVECNLAAFIKDPVNGEVLIRVTKSGYLIEPGINTIPPNSLRPDFVEYGKSTRSNYIRNYKKLSSGTYQYCVNIEVLSGESSDARYCRAIQKVTNEFLKLVTPENGAVLKEKLPILVWNTTEPMLKNSQRDRYRLVLVEKNNDQSPAQAVQTNSPIFQKMPLVSFSIPYPADSPELKEGDEYAWIVYHDVDGKVVNKTQAWSFKIHEESPEDPIKYVALKSTFDGSEYKAVEDKVYFKLDERYRANYDFPEYRITDQKGNEVEKDPIFEPSAEYTTRNKELSDDTNSDESVGKRHGFNRYELDLSSLNLNAGTYNLFVKNSKGEVFKLKFTIDD